MGVLLGSLACSHPQIWSPLCSSLSSWWLQSSARLKPRQKLLLTLTTDTTDTTDSSMDTVTLVTPITDTAISDTTDTGSTTVKGRLSLTTAMDTMVTMVMVTTDTAISDTMDTMATMDMDMHTAISTARGKLMPRLITMDT